MGYREFLKLSIAKQGMSLSNICEGLNELGFKTDKAYLSKLQNGKIPPAGDKMNDALAKVLSIESIELKAAAYREKIPIEVLEHMKRY